MTKFVPLVIGVLLVLAAVGGAVLALSGRAPSQAPEAIGAPGSTSRAEASSKDAPPAPPPRAGRVLELDDALRELDLIRPSRQKLAEDFALGMADGKSFRLSDHRGKTVIINFWATWCPPCREEMPALERLYRQHKNRGLVLVAVSIDADPKLVPPYVRASKLTFPVALDPKAEVASKYGVRALPSSFIIDRRGTMTALALGPRAWDNDASHSLVEALTSDGHDQLTATGRQGSRPLGSTTR
jgi:peroxiredoxin